MSLSKISVILVVFLSLFALQTGAAERTNLITMNGNPLTLVGDEVKVGDQAPDFTVVDNNMTPLTFSDHVGEKIYVISTVPSLDTPVCSKQTHTFNEHATTLSEKVEILTISMDLPFAQKRWCGAEGVEHVKTLSDHREASFGHHYGILIKENRLLARAIFIVDQEGIIRYIEIVDDITHEPNYKQVLAKLDELL